jgi:hypothetical protein
MTGWVALGHALACGKSWKTARTTSSPSEASRGEVPRGGMGVAVPR